MPAKQLRELKQFILVDNNGDPVLNAAGKIQVRLEDTSGLTLVDNLDAPSKATGLVLTDTSYSDVSVITPITSSNQNISQNSYVAVTQNDGSDNLYRAKSDQAGISTSTDFTVSANWAIVAAGDVDLSSYLTSTQIADLYYSKTTLDTSLAGKVDDSQVLTNVPSGALFTDTNKFLSSATGVGTGTLSLVVSNGTDVSLDMANYLNSNFTIALDGLSNVDTSGVSSSQVLTYNGTSWDAQTPAAAKHVSSGQVVDGADSDSYLDTIELTLSDSTKVDISISALVTEILARVPTDNNKFINSWAFNSTSKMLSMTYNDGSTTLPNIDLSSLVDAVTSLNALTDVTISSTGEGQTLVFTGTKWINKRLSVNDLEEIKDATTHEVGDVLIREAAGYEARNLSTSDLSDVDTDAATSGNLLRFNGSVWEDRSLPQTVDDLTASAKQAIVTSLGIAPNGGEDSGHIIASGVGNLGASTLIEIEVDGKKYYTNFQVESYKDFSIGISGSPTSSSVYVNQPNFTITVGTSAGTLTSVNSINTSVETGTVSGNSASFTGSMYEAEGSYTVTANATGESEHPTPLAQTRSASSAWNRFVPSYWVVSSSIPTTLPSAGNGVTFATRTVTGTTGQGIYLINNTLWI